MNQNYLQMTYMQKTYILSKKRRRRRRRRPDEVIAIIITNCAFHVSQWRMFRAYAYY